jgi:hypothetical protein
MPVSAGGCRKIILVVAGKRRVPAHIRTCGLSKKEKGAMGAGIWNTVTI